MSVRSCASCGAEVSPKARFCGDCGARLSTPLEEAERRQVTVLFVDLVGFTSMSKRIGAEAMHALLNRTFAATDKVIRDHGGHIDKHIGDAVMAVFGAPVAHGDDPLRAVRAAMAIHSALSELDPPLEAHAGIATGVVVASLTGSSEHRTYTVIGDSVNLAARLMDAAKAGETLVAEEVARAVGDAMAFVPRGTRELKGIGTVELWAPLGVTSPSTGLSASAARPLVGREHELMAFVQDIGACLARGLGSSVLVRGEPGIGKSRLAEAVMASAGEQGLVVHRGWIADFGQDSADEAFARLVRGLLGIPSGPCSAETWQAALNAIEGGVQLAGSAWLGELCGVPLRFGSMDHRHADDERAQALAALVVGMAQRRPRLLVLEDVHWATPTQLVLLEALVRCTREAPVLLLWTSRHEGRAVEAGSLADRVVDLRPLDLDQARALARLCVDDTALADECAVRAQGNPLFLEQLARHASGGARGEALPGTLQSLVQARTDRLGLSQRRALQVASVLGQRFDLAWLRALLDDPAFSVGGLEEAGLLRPQGERWMFVHALVRQGVYDGLLRDRRVALHLKAATHFRGLDTELVAEHLELAGDPSASQAFEQAALEAVARLDFNRAERLLLRARPETPDEELRIQLQLGHVQTESGQAEPAMRAWDRADALAHTDADRLRVWLGRAHCLRLSSELDQALMWLDRAESLAGDDALLAEMSYLRGNLLFMLLRADDCEASHRRAVDLARRSGRADLEARALGGLGDAAYFRGKMATAIEWFSLGVSKAVSVGAVHIEASLRAMVAFASYCRLDLVRSEAEAIEAVRLAQSVGSRRAELVATHAIAMLAIERGDLAAMSAALERANVLCRDVRSTLFAHEGVVFEAQTLADRGDYAAARRHLEPVRAFVAHETRGYFGCWLHGAMAACAVDHAELVVLEAAGLAAERPDEMQLGRLMFHVGIMDGCERFADPERLEAHARAIEGLDPEYLGGTAGLHRDHGLAVAAWLRGDAGARDRLEALRERMRALGSLRIVRRIDALLERGQGVVGRG